MNRDIINNDIINKNINNYLNCIDIIYWINLDRSTDRRTKMINLLKNINIPNQRITAIDGSKVSDDYIVSHFINDDYKASKIEYACLLSHLKTIETFSLSNHNTALIFEDDVCLDYFKYWNLTICEIINNAPIDWDIIMLNYISNNTVPNLYTLNKKGEYSSCLAYLINKKAALKLMKKIKVDNKFKLPNEYWHTADNFTYSLLNTYVYKYSYFTYHDNNDSNIHNWHLDYHTKSKQLITKDWINYYNPNKFIEKFDNIYINYNINKILLFLMIIIVVIIIVK